MCLLFDWSMLLILKQAQRFVLDRRKITCTLLLRKGAIRTVVLLEVETRRKVFPSVSLPAAGARTRIDKMGTLHLEL